MSKKRKRDERGRFAAIAGAYVDDRGYIRISAGPQRGKRLHRLIAEAKLGRPLTKDEDAHHADGNKLNNAPRNIHVEGHREHGCVSAKQHHVLKGLDISLKGDWDTYFEEANGGGADAAFP
jgi:hypothetical protein